MNRLLTTVQRVTLNQSFLVHLLLVFLFINTSAAQPMDYVLDQDTAYSFTITGKSTLHDWTVLANEVKGVPEMLSIEWKTGSQIEPFGIELTVDKMDGGRGNSMNNKIRTALKSNQFPVVAYKMTSPAILQLRANGKRIIRTTGNLEIGGESRGINLEAEIKMESDGITVEGSYPMKLSDFNIDPPTAMFGQIKTKDDITAHFIIRYIKK